MNLAATGEPLFLQIARAIVADIQRGRIRSGERLPGTRTLAKTLAVHRNTVVAAYDELLAEGWVETSRASGTFVTRTLPEIRRKRRLSRAFPQVELPGRLGFDLRPGPVPIDSPRAPFGVLTMGGGTPDVRLVPTAALARAYRRAVRQQTREVFGYGQPYGHPRLRTALALLLASRRGLATEPDDVLVVRGSQMALDLVGRALVAPGDVVAVEALGYRPAWEAFRQYGAKLLAIRVDEQGLDVAALAALSERRRLRAVYVTPHHQYPTTATMTAARRVALLELARRQRFAVIEDDYDHEFHYEGRPVLPLASADHAGVVIYIGTLSKILAPGLRLGYLVAPRPLVERLAAHRLYVDRQGDYAVESAVAELLEDGEVQRHARRVRRRYQARRDLLASQLWALGLSFELPAGGMAIWARIAPSIDVDAWASRALEHRVVFHTARHFAFDGRPRPYARFGFAGLDEDELSEATERLRRALEGLCLSVRK